MLRSMYSGVSGLKTHQTKLDVIGNNISNVNTVAFKSSDFTFKEMLSQTLQKAQTPAGDLGGTNPSQIGLGTTVANISTNHSSGNLQTTDNPYDLAIQGSGYFVVSDGLSTYYTRAGNFQIDSVGNFVTASGEKILGWNREADFSIDTSNPVEPINLSNLQMPAKATTELVFTGNFDSTNEDDLHYNMTIYDSLGEAHTITVNFIVEDENSYSYTITSDEDGVNIDGGEGEFSFDSTGKLDIDDLEVEDITIEFENGAADVEILEENIIFDTEKLTQYDNSTTVSIAQDGYQAGVLTDDLAVDQSGNIIGNFSNGRNETVAVIALATFINPQGLEKVGNSLYKSSWNTGLPNIGVAGTDEIGTIAANALEMSNVDLAKEFTEMISAQRGFQANSKIITTSDEMLQELVNIKR